MKKREHIEVRAQKITSRDMYSCVGHEAQKAIEAVILTVKNKTDRQILINRSHIDLPLMNADEIASFFDKTSLSLAVKGGAIGLLAGIGIVIGIPFFLTGFSPLAPLLILMALGAPGSAAQLGVVVGSILGGTTVIGATANVAMPPTLNKEFVHITKTVKESCDIEPYEKKTMILFVKKVPRRFDLKIFRKEKDPVSFTVKCKERRI